MKPRARRIMIGAVGLVAVLLVVLVVACWGTVRDHVEAWHFQLTKETQTITRQSAPPISYSHDVNTQDLFWVLADDSFLPVVFDPIEVKQHGMRLWSSSDDRIWDALGKLKESGWRILEQRFPRRAYVVIRDADPREPVLVPPERPARTFSWPAHK